MNSLRYWISLCCLLFGPLLAAAQQIELSPASAPPRPDTSYLVVREVIIQGNKKTRTSIILRELSTVPGDTIYLRDLSEILEERRKQLLNTSLFLNVTANIRSWSGDHADIVFEVWERWYTFAFPIFKLADRNFNQWWVEQKRSLDRVNVGVKGYQENMSGRNDRLSAEVQLGYTQRIGAAYNLPYIDKRYRHGLGFSFAYSRNREVNDSTVDNKQQFFRNREFQRQQYTAALTYTYRRAINTRHQVILSYNFDKVSDSVVIRNPDYFGNGRHRVQYLDLMYRVSYIKADSWQYPLKGVSLEADISKQGIPPFDDISHVRIHLKAIRYWQLFRKTYAALGIRAQAKFPADQPYVNQRAIGYMDDYLRGLEYYVVDGTSYAIFKSTLRREMAAFKMHLPIVPKKFNTVPIRLMAKIYGDVGYGYSKFPGGPLNNRMLYTGGVGLDIVTFYDACLRVEYSMNQLGQKGLFLHGQLDM